MRTLIALITVVGGLLFADVVSRPQPSTRMRTKDPEFIKAPEEYRPAVKQVEIRNLDACNADLDDATRTANAELSTWKARIRGTERLINRNKIGTADILALDEEELRAAGVKKDLQAYAIACLAVATLAHASGVPENKLEKWPPLIAVNDSLNSFEDISRSSQRVAQRARRNLHRLKGTTAHKATLKIP